MEYFIENFILINILKTIEDVRNPLKSAKNQIFGEILKWLLKKDIYFYLSV